MVLEEIWTIKELFVYPNEYIYWSIQIVMYPFMTGLVAGAFVLSSLYHLFGIKPLKEIARFSLVFSFALLMVAPLPLLLHLMQPGTEFLCCPDPPFHLGHRRFRGRSLCLRLDCRLRAVVPLPKTPGGRFLKTQEPVE